MQARRVRVMEKSPPGHSSAALEFYQLQGVRAPPIRAPFGICMPSVFAQALSWLRAHPLATELRLWNGAQECPLPAQGGHACELPKAAIQRRTP